MGDRPIRALLVIGGCCHDYRAQKDILTKGVSARANVEWTVAYDPDKTNSHKNPVYDSADWAKGFDVVVHDECSSQVKDPQVVERILKPHREGLPAVVLHCGMHSYRSKGYPKHTPWFEFTGVGSTGHGPQVPIVVTYTDKEHPITRPLKDWTTIREELYNNTRLYETATPLARGRQTIRNRRTGQERVEEHVVVWTNTYAGRTRIFATTLGHNNETVGDERHLDLVARGLLWAVDKLDETHLKPAKKVLSDEKGQQAGATMKGLDYAKAYARIKDIKGDPQAGAALFTQLGCGNCHTVVQNDPPKGPYLGDIATRYGRGDLLESILTPSSKIAQGFETQFFRTKKGEVVEGFVTRESAREIEYRDVNGAVHTIKQSDIDRRGGRELSMMPEGLADNLTAEQLAGLLAYLESLKGP